VLPRLLRALAAAHAAGWVHCDVRPSNIVATPAGAMLVDWGAAARAGGAARRGVLAYSAGVFKAAKLPRAHPAIDASGALYTWLTVAYGRACVAPWLRSPAPASDAAMVLERGAWVAGLAGAEPRVARVAAALETLNEALVAGAALRDALGLAAEALQLQAAAGLQTQV
jgi:serine/threonine-protein kinase